MPPVYSGHRLEGSLAFGGSWETSREEIVVCDVPQTIKNNPNVDEGGGGGSFSISLVTSRLSNATHRLRSTSIFNGPSHHPRSSSRPISRLVCKLLTGHFEEPDQMTFTLHRISLHLSHLVFWIFAGDIFHHRHLIFCWLFFSPVATGRPRRVFADTKANVSPT